MPRWIVDRETFLQRLEQLEAWLWSHTMQLGLGRSVDVDRLARRVVELSDVYTTQRDQLTTAGDTSHLVAKVLYFLISDAPKLWFVLDELARRQCLPLIEPGQPLRVIDLGGGVGATAAGLLLAVDSTQLGKVNLLGVDAHEHGLAIYAKVAHQAAAIARVDAQITTQQADLREPPESLLRRPADLVVTQALVNELFPAVRSSDPAAGAQVQQAAAWVHPWASRCTTVVIEPALRETTRPLQALRDQLVREGLRAIAPCPHQLACPLLVHAHEWCHQTPRIQPPPQVAQVQQLTRRRDDRCKFSFVVLGPPRDIASIETSDDQRVLRLLSDPLGSKGKTERYACAADGQLITLRLLDRERSQSNQAFLELPTGSLIALPATSVPRIKPDATLTRVG